MKTDSGVLGLNPDYNSSILSPSFLIYKMEFYLTAFYEDQMRYWKHLTCEVDFS